MLFSQELFDEVEAFLDEDGSLAEFEQENGEVLGRMMIDMIDPPENMNLQIPEGSYGFGASFDFCDCVIGLVLDPETKKAGSGIWSVEQEDGAEPPTQGMIEFFMDTLLDQIESGDSFAFPMFTLIAENGSLTVMPVEEDGE